MVERSIGRLGLAVTIWLATENAANGQNIVVDVAPSHVANSFSPFARSGRRSTACGRRARVVEWQAASPLRLAKPLVRRSKNTWKPS